MPTYDYKCNACEHAFEVFHLMNEDNPPSKKPCPECGKKEVTKSWSRCTPGLCSDSLVTPNKKTGGDWDEIMVRVKDYIPERFRSNIDRASNRNARRWYG